MRFAKPRKPLNSKDTDALVKRLQIESVDIVWNLRTGDRIVFRGADVVVIENDPSEHMLYCKPDVDEDEAPLVAAAAQERIKVHYTAVQKIYFDPKPVTDTPTDEDSPTPSPAPSPCYSSPNDPDSDSDSEICKLQKKKGGAKPPKTLIDAVPPPFVIPLMQWVSINAEAQMKTNEYVQERNRETVRFNKELEQKMNSVITMITGLSTGPDVDVMSACQDMQDGQATLHTKIDAVESKLDAVLSKLAEGRPAQEQSWTSTADFLTPLSIDAHPDLQTPMRATQRRVSPSPRPIQRQVPFQSSAAATAPVQAMLPGGWFSYPLDKTWTNYELPCGPRDSVPDGETGRPLQEQLSKEGVITYKFWDTHPLITLHDQDNKLITEGRTKNGGNAVVIRFFTSIDLESIVKKVDTDSKQAGFTVNKLASIAFRLLTATYSADEIKQFVVSAPESLKGKDPIYLFCRASRQVRIALLLVLSASDAELTDDTIFVLFRTMQAKLCNKNNGQPKKKRTQKECNDTENKRPRTNDSEQLVMHL